jgi:hypothetical protein
MRTFKRNIPTSHKDQARGQGLKLQELIATRQMFRSRKRQDRRHSASRNQHVLAFQDVVAHRRCCRPHKAHTAVESLDAGTGKILLKEFWRWPRLRAFEAHQFLPLTAIAAPVRKALRSPFHSLLYRARQRRGLRVFAMD